MGISHKDFKKKLLKDPEVRKEHEAMKILLTRQGGIRGGIEGLLVEYCNCDSGVHCNWANALNDGVVGEILSYLHSQGIRLPDGSSLMAEDNPKTLDTP